MHDQADHLRRMVLTAGPRADARQTARPLLVISGGSTGVGVTTLAIALAIEWARHAHSRVRLVDANFTHPDLAARCGLAGKGTVGDVLAGRRTMGEVLLRGPNGIQIAPGDRCEPPVVERLFAHSGARWLDHLRRPGSGADVVIIDAGAGRGEIAGRLWETATILLLATTPAPDAILDGYAAIKSAAQRATPEKICVVVNRLQPHRGAHGQIEQRIRQTCRRFLAADIDAGPSVPEQHARDRPGSYRSSISNQVGKESLAPSVRPLAQHLAVRLGLTNASWDRPHESATVSPGYRSPPSRPLAIAGWTDGSRDGAENQSALR